MKVKTSITLSSDLLTLMDQRLNATKNRSEFIECAIRDYMKRLARQERDARDMALINQNAENLNVEALDVIQDQIL
ncbi:MAG: hypothetical protein WCL57_13135 [Chloroflexota bacterium]